MKQKSTKHNGFHDGELIEHLARRIHEGWMKIRSTEGWTYGPEKNDTLKTHPCMVDYDSLPESEKDIDRNSARITIERMEQLRDDSFQI